VRKTRYNAGRANKSLDASRTSGLVIDSLRVTQLRAAASTQPFGRFPFMRLPQLSIVVLLLACVATAACGCRFAKDDDVRQMRQRVETALPLGSTPAQVTKFLDDLHIKNGHGGWQFYDTHRYDGLEQIEGNIQGGRSDTPAGTSSSFSAMVSSSNGGSRATAVADVIPCAGTILVQEHQRRLFRLLRTLTTIGRCVVYVLAATEQIVGPEPRGATFASNVIRLSCSVAPWPGQLNRWVAVTTMLRAALESDIANLPSLKRKASRGNRYSG